MKSFSDMPLKGRRARCSEKGASWGPQAGNLFSWKPSSLPHSVYAAKPLLSAKFREFFTRPATEMSTLRQNGTIRPGSRAPQRQSESLEPIGFAASRDFSARTKPGEAARE